VQSTGAAVYLGTGWLRDTGKRIERVEPQTGRGSASTVHNTASQGAAPNEGLTYKVCWQFKVSDNRGL
jgi:hypothetical protein